MGYFTFCLFANFLYCICLETKNLARDNSKLNALKTLLCSGGGGGGGGSTSVGNLPATFSLSITADEELATNSRKQSQKNLSILYIFL